MRIHFITLKWLTTILVIAIISFVIFVYARANRTYDAPFPEITAIQDSVMIARGKHLFYGPAHCATCHVPRSERTRLNLGEEVPPSGGEDFDLPIGMIYAPNITPDIETGIGSYTDQEIARAMRFGVKRNGHAMMDFMPFYDLSDDDLTAIISYLRSIPPVKNQRPEHDWNFMGKAVRAIGLIKPMGDEFVPPAPPEDTTAAYGHYVAVSIANCKGCHTKRDMRTGAWIGIDFAGQLEMEVLDDQGNIIPDLHMVTPNLTPDPETGRITNWTQEMFVNRFRAGKLIPGSVMPWEQFKIMTDLELIAVYKYLQSLDPVVATKPIPVGIQDGPPAIK